jgi:radical SAM protein with 4Fe4S-binding SPASM domain
MNWRQSYLRLAPAAALKRLEIPYIYHTGGDELYEIDDRAVDFLVQCDGRTKGEALTDDAEFVEYSIEEGILEVLAAPAPIDITIDQSPLPSLRYLELHLTHRCHLKCRHCYLGRSRPADLPLADAVDITRQFAEMGGLRLLISGGEPMAYNALPAYLEAIRDLKIRRILFTNGTRITEENIKELDVDEIQFSLDGWQEGHDWLRGPGVFEKTVNGVNIAREAGIPVSFSTMIHRGNITEFGRMHKFMAEVEAVEWGIDILTVAGSLESHEDVTVPYEQAAPLMTYAYGGGYHGASDGYACGRHLMAVIPDGKAVKCGFFRDHPLGDARQSLKDCWLNMRHIRLDELECRDCPVLEECRGGCRFRAPHPLAPDPAMCRLYGINR